MSDSASVRESAIDATDAAATIEVPVSNLTQRLTSEGVIPPGFFSNVDAYFYAENSHSGKLEPLPKLAEALKQKPPSSAAAATASAFASAQSQSQSRNESMESDVIKINVKYNSTTLKFMVRRDSTVKHVLRLACTAFGDTHTSTLGCLFYGGCILDDTLKLNELDLGEEKNFEIEAL